jgi:hypothetical protein
LDFDEYLNLKDQKYFQHPSLPKLTRYYKGVCDGIERTLFSILQNEWVEWMHYYVDDKGNTVYTKEWGSIPTEIRYGKTTQIKSNHFWKNPRNINNPNPWGTEKLAKV